MTTGLDQPDRHCRDALVALTAEFDGVLPREVLSGTVLAARRDLDGQVARDSLTEMLYHLAHHRLDRLRIGA
ncbi:hypothetical protein ACFYOT_36015 [Saccharothrix saharensis]|uniref:hypothetical protein n=1 Tax=Saccharothrix saharensis TaxID=571190 RepID=UPI003676C56E